MALRPLVPFLLLAAACTGAVGRPSDRETPEETPGPGPSRPPPASPPAANACVRQLPPAPLRRLTHEEYANTVRDLLRLDARPDLGLPQEGEVFGLTNNVAQQTLSPALIERYHGLAERLGARAIEDLPRLTGCDPATRGEEACSASLIDGFGARAFRRPLAPDERQALSTVFTKVRAETDFKTAARAVVEALLIAPQFLFRWEPGTSTALDGWAIATRLSYMVWGTMPDDALFEAARAGKLQSPADITTQVTRMLADTRARDTIRRVHAEWLDFDRVADLKKDAKAFPEFVPGLQASMRGELDRFIDSVWEKRGGSLEALFTSADSFVDGPLAKLYGATGVTGAEMVPVTLDPMRRAGVLTRAGVLAAISGEADTGLVHRGLFVRERLLCQPVPPPPPNVESKLPAPDPKQTTRERFARHEEDPTCGSCHKLIDPIGLSLESYDAIGRWRPNENGLPIDTSGELSGVEGGGKYDGGVGLGKMLASSPTARACVTKVWFRYAFGRTETEQDNCTLGQLGTALASGRTRDLLLAIATSDAFRLRSP